MIASPLLRFAALGLFACAAQAADFSGTWTGSIDIHFGDGRVINDSVWLKLSQTGTRIEGSAGPAVDRLKPIRDGKANGDELEFSTESGGGKELRFVLRLKNDGLAGEAEGEMGADRVHAHVEATRRDPAHARGTLFDEIMAADSKLFDAYNRRDVDGVMAMFTPDLEFYHDRGGFSDYEQNRKQLGQALGEATRHRRELVPDSVRVSPLGESFALETGTHRFYDTPQNGSETLAATAQFVQVWQRTRDGWRLRRVISFDHR